MHRISTIIPAMSKTDKGIETPNITPRLEFDYDDYDGIGSLVTTIFITSSTLSA